MLKYASLVERTLIFVLTIVRYSPSAYNIDVNSAEVFRDPVSLLSYKHNSYFGFSVALYVGANESILLVGAPRANSSELQFVTEPGTVFRCKINDVQNGCTEWPIDKTENDPRKGIMSQIKDNAWIGATIAVQNKTEARVVVCGPRWIMINNNTINKNTNWRMNGICYTTLARNANAFEREAEEYLLPLSNSGNQVASKNNVSIYNYELGQAGFSLHMNSRDPMNIAMGSPGVYNWKGHVILAQVNNSLLDIVIPPFAEEVYSYNYFGYAITAGCYFDKRNIYYASSAPKGAQMYGLILVFNFSFKTNYKNMFVITKIYGQQYGEYFGAALTSCDVNNDGRHELIVGAPQWSRDMDEGRVYVFTTRHYNHFEKLQTIEGEIFGGRFGSAVMCLGDIDYDGYGDIAVGAPYEEDSGGAVYIFNGNENGVSRKYSQRLVGSQFSSTMRGFGISISEPRDVNRDNQSDIAVGAYLSNEVVLLKSITVVTINVTFESRPKLLKNIKFFELDIAMIFKGAPKCLYVNTILKIDQTYRRASYLKTEYNGDYSWFYHLRRESPFIISLPIHLKENIQNMINPLEISISLKLDDAKIKKCCESCVIDKRRSKTEDVIELPFLNFENDTDVNNKASDLGVTLSTDSNPNNRYIIGNFESIMLHIDICNRGKPAYQTRLHIVTEVLMLASLPPECIENSHIRNILDVICNVGDPLTTNKRLTLQLDMSMVRYNVTEIKLQASVSTQSNEINLNDNTHVITIYFDVDVGLTIVGKAQENLYSYGNEERILNGIRFQHFYEVQNFGISPVEEAVLILKIPTHIYRGDTGRIAIVNINNIIGKMDGHELYCNSRQAEFSFALKKTVSMHKIIIKKSSSIANKSMHAKFSINVPARTFYVNCTNNAVYCAQFDCRLRPFLNSLSVAKFLVTLDLHRSKFPDDMMKDKDIIFYVTEGSINIIQPYVTQRNGNKSDILIATTFLNPIVEGITTTCIVVSVFLGTILLICLIGCLKQVGFFHRERIDLIEALKAETDLHIKIV